MSLPDRLASISSRDETAALLGRRDKEADSSDNAGTGWMQKCVIIQRDEKGYGFTVSGDNPVFVASVKQDGAAARAGVQNGDRIVKVNGTLVTQRNHLDVVRLIKSGSYVALTLLGKPTPSASGGVISHPSSFSSVRDSMFGRVTAPQPVDPDKDRELWQHKVHMTRAMYETAKEDFEKLQKQYVSKPSEKLHGLLLEKERTVKALDNQLKQLTGGDEPVTVTLPTPTISDLGSMSDSSQTSPSVSPTPDDIHSRHNGQDVEILVGQQEIIQPEYEEESSDEEQANDPGPFAEMKLLENKPAHLAVLLNYLISNSDPSPVLFHIISDLYARSTGSNKELRKWAYEIFSTFIYKMAPLSISVEDNLISQIDSILTSSGSRTDNENVLRAMFQAPRQSVQVEIADLLMDFRSKKDLGMGNLYGIQKIHDNMDRTAEVKVAEELLMPHLKYFVTEDNSRGALVDKDLATGWALATFLRSLGGSKSTHVAALDRIQTFMTKDKKSIKFPGTRSSRAKAVKGHQFNLQHFYVTTFCTYCGNLIWGVGYQGYQCQNCEMMVHKSCPDEITEMCVGKQRRRISAKLPLAGVIPNRKLSSYSPGQPQTAPEQTPQPPSTPGQSPPHTDVITQPYPKEEDSDLAGLSGSYSVQNMVNRIQALASPTGPAQVGLGLVAVQQDTPADVLATNRITERRDSSNLNRSGSLNSKGKKTERPARRAKSDVEVDTDTFKEIHQSASSSASSLSNRSVESPGSSSTDSVNDLLRAQYDDPDMDVEPDLPPLKHVLPEDVLRKLKPKEKKRQEVINELFYTERAHLRNLKVLDLLFNRPMYQEKGIMAELARALFPNMEEMISLHVNLVRDIKERSQHTPVVKDVGDLLLKRFDGEAGERFRKGCAEYCRNQAFALDALKKQTRKELKLQQFLHDTESNSLCRRLQLKDLVPSQMQRLTKYPLLIDNLLKYTQSQSDEYRILERAHEKCKHILAYVNHSVKECENYHKLKDIQKKLDRRSLEGLSDPAVVELKSLDLTQHKLIFDSPLTWKLRSHRMVDLHVLLFEDLLVLLQKQDDKYILKCQNTNVQPARDDKYTHFPVLKLQNLLARTLATEKRSFFVVNISESRAQMYEFTAASSELRLKWCKLINEKADEFKTMSSVPYMHSGDHSQASQAQQSGRLSRLSQSNNSSQFDQPGSPTPDIFEVTEQLSRRLDICEDPHPEGELILPEEVSVSDAVSTKSSTVSSPQATLSPAVSCQQIQPPPQLLQQLSLSTPVSMERLKNMATEMNVILSKLAGTINSGNDEKQRMRQELENAQLRLDSLKQMKKQITESGTSPSGRASPCSPLLSDIPLMSETASTDSGITGATLTANTDTSELCYENVVPTPSSLLAWLPQQEADVLKEKYGLEVNDEGNISLTSSLGGDGSLTSSLAGDVSLTPSLADDVHQPWSSGKDSFHPGIQETTVIQLEESVEHLSLCTDTGQVVPVVAMETQIWDDVLVGDRPVTDMGDDSDSDSNAVSVADLPLPDMASIQQDHGLVLTQRLRDGSLVSTQRLRDDDSEADSDDYDMLTSKADYHGLNSSATAVEENAGGELTGAASVSGQTSSSVIDAESVSVSGGGETTHKGQDEEVSSWQDA